MTSSVSSILTMLPLLNKNELLQIENMSRLLAMQKREDGREFTQLYTVLQRLLTRDGHRVPPIYVLSQRGGTARRDVEFAMEAVTVLGKQFGLRSPELPSLLVFLYDLCRAHMQNAKIKMTLRTVCVQLQQARGLVSNEFPDYPPQVLRQLVMGRDPVPALEST